MLVLLALTTVWAFRGGDQTQYITAKIERGNIYDTVEATGTINAVTTVQVGSQVSGTIARLNADFNSRVRQGEVIALIDPALFQGALQGAAADLEDAKANVDSSVASLKKAQATAAQTRADYVRAAALIRENAESQQLFDLAKANFEVARAGAEAAVANVAQAEAQVRQKEAAVSVAQTNLNYTTIRSPIDGIVVARNVDVGQTVAASLQAPTIFTIAQDLTKMQVYAKTDESDVGRIKVGRRVTFKVDAFPKDIFEGTVSQIRMNATTVQNVVTYDTIIDFANPHLKLFPGMTAFVTIPVAAANAALKIPNTALRFMPVLPQAHIRSLYARYGIDTGSDASRTDDGARHPGGPTSGEGTIIWKQQPGGELRPVKIELGITDHAFTQVVRVAAGTLTEGDNVVTAALASETARH